MTTSVLCFEQLLTNKKPYSFALINDTVNLSALPVLVDIGKHAIEQEKSLIVLLTETSPSFWLEQFEPNQRNKIFIVDAYSNPHGWDEATTANKHDSIVQINQVKDMEKLILSPIIEKATQTPNCTILIDSITPLAFISQHRTYQLVKALESLTTGMLVNLLPTLCFILNDVE